LERKRGRAGCEGREGGVGEGGMACCKGGVGGEGVGGEYNLDWECRVSDVMGCVLMRRKARTYIEVNGAVETRS
jgi:hypothetical protein